jgi:hypothetical protein
LKLATFSHMATIAQNNAGVFPDEIQTIEKSACGR